MIKLSDPISSLDGIGPKLTQVLAGKGIINISDLLFYLPRKYDDYSKISPINLLKPGLVTINAGITAIKTRRGRRGLSITEAIASDNTGSVRIVWFNQPYRQSSLKHNEKYYLSGEYKLSNRHFSMINPSVELISDMPLNSARIMPVYKESKSLNSNLLRKVIYQALPLCDEIKETIPASIIKDIGLIKLSEALKTIHYPKDQDELNQAIFRFKFEQLFPLLLANEITNKEREKEVSLKVRFNQELAKNFVKALPFELTDDQRRVIWQIYLDMEKDKPMNRLVEGDVGSGKTVVAVMSAVMAQAEGYKVAFLAPTELLAKQHAQNIEKLLKPLNMDKQLLVLTGSMKAKDKKTVTEKANTLKNCFVIGTHSLLTSNIDWHNLALIIVDEQHRFGVEQRTTLQKKTGHIPHFLSITATPIPRSLALTILNDLDISLLKTVPKNRKPISSELVSPSETNRFYQKLKDNLAAGRQAYVVCPHIHSKNKMDKQSTEFLLDEYRKHFSKYKVEMINGQMPSIEQDRIMQQFLDNKIHILIATTVIEVGVDVVNASVMAIYGPERFGLAQLHQLRGRIGRGPYESYCYLMLSDSMQPLPRLREFIRIRDGFSLSELDLKLRGPGAIYGKLQHGKGLGFMLTLDDQELANKVKKAVNIFFANKESLLKYKELDHRVKQARQITYLN